MITASGVHALDPRRSAFVSIALVAAVWLLTLFTLDLRGMWITDNENKLLQTRAMLAGGGSDSSLRWPGREFDPQLETNPIPAPFSHVKDGRIWSQYPPAFAALSTLPLRWFSFPGLYLLPWLGAVLALAAVARLSRQVGLKTTGVHAAVLLAGLGTPLWFYAVVFWEHSLALGLALWSLHLALGDAHAGSRRDAACAGALAAAGVWLRDEMILIGVLVILLVLLDARSRRWRAAAIAGTAFATGLALLFVFQSAMIDSPLGYHVQSNLSGLGDHLRSRPTVFYRLFLAAGPDTLRSVAITAPFVAGWIRFPGIRALHATAWLTAVSGIATLAGLVWLVGFFVARRGPIAHLLTANSLFAAAPFLLLACLRPSEAAPDARSDRAARRLHQIALAYAALYALLAPAAASQGIHWGNRFLLPLYPLFTVLAVRGALSTWRSSRKTFVAALALCCVAALSLAAQVYSLGLLGQKTEFSRRLNQEVAARLEPAVVTDVWWVPQALFDVFHVKPIFLVGNREQLARIEASMRARGVLRYAFVGSVIGRELRPGEVQVDDGGLRFFSVAIASRAVSP